MHLTFQSFVHLFETQLHKRSYSGLNKVWINSLLQVIYTIVD